MATEFMLELRALPLCSVYRRLPYSCDVLRHSVNNGFSSLSLSLALRAFAHTRLPPEEAPEDSFSFFRMIFSTAFDCFICADVSSVRPSVSAMRCTASISIWYCFASKSGE